MDISIHKTKESQFLRQRLIGPSPTCIGIRSTDIGKVSRRYDSSCELPGRTVWCTRIRRIRICRASLPYEFSRGLAIRAGSWWRASKTDKRIFSREARRLQGKGWGNEERLHGWTSTSLHRSPPKRFLFSHPRQNPRFLSLLSRSLFLNYLQGVMAESLYSFTFITI